MSTFSNLILTALFFAGLSVLFTSAQFFPFVEIRRKFPFFDKGFLISLVMGFAGYLFTVSGIPKFNSLNSLVVMFDACKCAAISVLFYAMARK